MAMEAHTRRCRDAIDWLAYEPKLIFDSDQHKQINIGQARSMDAETQSQLLNGFISLAVAAIVGLCAFIMKYIKEINRQLVAFDKILAVMQAKDEAQQVRIESQDERIRRLEVIRFRGKT